MAHVGQARGRLVQVGEHDGQLAVASERRRAGEALVEQAAERVDVCAPVDLAALDLLGRHVSDRANEAALAGQAADGGDMARKPEVADVGVLAFLFLPDEDVSRLDVPVDEPGLVRRVERRRHLLDEPDCPFRFELPLAVEKFT